MKSSLKSVVALFLYVCLSFSTIASIGCDATKAPSRSELESLAQGGRIAGNVLEANATLPDQLLSANVIKQELHDELVTGINEARADIKTFNDGMADVLKAEKPDLKPLLPVALRLVQRIHALNRTDIPGWNAVFTLAEIGISTIATYFAIKISDLRHAGFSDKQICAAAGVKYDARLFALIESYAPVNGSTAGE